MFTNPFVIVEQADGKTNVIALAMIQHIRIEKTNADPEGKAFVQFGTGSVWLDQQATKQLVAMLKDKLWIRDPTRQEVFGV